MPRYRIKIHCMFCGKDITENMKKGFYADTDKFIEDFEADKVGFHAIETDDENIILFCNKRCLRLHMVYWDSMFEDALA